MCLDIRQPSTLYKHSCEICGTLFLRHVYFKTFSSLLLSQLCIFTNNSILSLGAYFESYLNKHSENIFEICYYFSSYEGLRTCHCTRLLGKSPTDHPYHPSPPSQLMPNFVATLYQWWVWSDRIQCCYNVASTLKMNVMSQCCGNVATVLVTTFRQYCVNIVWTFVPNVSWMLWKHCGPTKVPTFTQHCTIHKNLCNFQCWTNTPRIKNSIFHFENWI